MDIVERNLAAVAEHIANEARDPAEVMPLYTDDVVVEFPARNLKFEGKAAIEANYRRMFAAIEQPSLEPLDRFATHDRVVDDMIVRFRIVGEGMDNAPVKIGDRVALRLVHIFHMRDGLIAREIVHEDWQVE
ncbi:nuclear transport factor 2 family protein [Sphingomicrobium flavum]|uniref:nuclear transport factor 2 family protein n=1 Tax=Sphingomicrobium flavum TaxID=1229164 RepID=UPI0021ADB7B9|nr:nuclear transport factor 2 family protein [Sphingomicrobium flavum]